MKTNLIKIGNQFKAELAAQYSLPEIAAAEFSPVKTHTESGNPDWHHTSTGAVAVAPSGQLAGIVKELTVEVTIGSNGKTTRGVLKYSYGHHSGGSNGNDQSFEIVTESRCGDDVEYVGKISERLAYVFLSRVNELRRASK